MASIYPCMANKRRFKLVRYIGQKIAAEFFLLAQLVYLSFLLPCPFLYFLLHIVYRVGAHMFAQGIAQVAAEFQVMDKLINES